MKTLILELGTDQEGLSIEYSKKKKELYFSVWDSGATRKTFVAHCLTLKQFRENVRMKNHENSA